jgi:hypothetical protein
MKHSILIAAIILVSAFFACTNQNEPAPGTAPATEPHYEVDLVQSMGRMQLYMNKMYFAGINGNSELRDFYVHEIEETMESIEEGHVMHEGVNISQNMKLFGLDQLEVFERAISADTTGFRNAYGQFLLSCNNCHTASKYPFIVIKEPTNPVFDNQVYEPR